MSNKYANLVGTNKIKDTYTDINTGFDGVDADISALNTRVDTIITTPAEGVTAQEIIDARKGEATLRNKIDGIDAQMAEKASQEDVDADLFKKRDKTTLIGMGDLSQEVKEGMTGGAVAVVGEGAVGTVNLQDYAVTPEKTNFLQPTYNVFNPRKVTVGKQIDRDTGEITPSQSHSISDFIEVEPNTTYYVSGTCAIRRYLADETYVNGTVNISNTTFSTGSTTRKIRLQVLNTQIYKFRLIKGSSDLEFVEHGYVSSTENTQIQAKILSEKNKNKHDSYLKENTMPFEKIELLQESSVSNQGCAIRDDYDVLWRNKEKSIRVDTVENAPYVRLTLGNTLDLIGVSEFVSILYIEDVSNISNITLSVGGTAWTRSLLNLKNGWNIIRSQTSAGDISNWTSTTALTYTFYTTGQSVIYLSSLTSIKHDKAKILFVNDHGYHRFKDIAYPQLKARGIPTTWAINPGRLGYSPIGLTESILTQEDIEELANDPYSEFSFHTWDPTAKQTEFMTADELREETHKCMHYIRKNGIMPRYFWRAAFVGNKAPQNEAIQDMMEAYASPVENVGIELYPFLNRYNISRVAIHSRDNAYFDTIFDTLKKCRPVYVCYTHGYDESGGIHITEAVFNYFLSKLDVAIAEGWIEGTTYSKLRSQYTDRDVVLDNIIDVL